MELPMSKLGEFGAKVYDPILGAGWGCGRKLLRTLGGGPAPAGLHRH